MDRTFALAGVVSAFIAVLAGAFGAHSLRARLTPELLEIFETAARYQMYHALGLLTLAWATTRWPVSSIRVGGWLFIAGTVVFSGSLYLLALTGTRWLGAITPLGGALLLGGWAAFAIALLKGTPQ